MEAQRKGFVSRHDSHTQTMNLGKRSVSLHDIIKTALGMKLDKEGGTTAVMHYPGDLDRMEIPIKLPSDPRGDLIR